MATSGQGAGSPGSSGSQGRRNTVRTEARKAIKLEAGRLAEAIALIPILDEATRNLRRGEPLNFSLPTAQGPQVLRYGRAEFKEFLNMIISQVKRLPDKAFVASKTRRTVASGAGFDAPQQFTPEIVQFFANANLGPVVNAQPMEEEGKIVPNEKTVQVIPNSRLNSQLFFTQPQINGQQNILAGIIPHGVLTPLFALHIHYEGGQDPNNARYISATRDMRQRLRQTLATTIQRDVEKFSLMYPGAVGQVQQTGQQLLQAIDNPQLMIDAKIGQDHMFNPNSFPFAHFSKIISAGKLPKEQQVGLKERLVAAGGDIVRIYGNVVPGVAQNPAAAADTVINYQRFAISSARALKNNEKAVQQKARRQQQAAAKRQQAQQAAALAAQQNAMQGGMVGQLPGMVGQLPGNLPNVGNLPTIGGGMGGLPTVGGGFQAGGLPTIGGGMGGLPTIGGLPSVGGFQQ
jgi:hypothetical protein